MRSLKHITAIALSCVQLAACAAGTTNDDEEPSDKPSSAGDKAGSKAPGEPNSGSDDGTPGDGTSPSPSTSSCVAQAACNGSSSPQLGAKRPWKHSIVSPSIALSGPALHRGRDQLLAVGDAQWVLGKITYNYVDTDLDDEEVDIYVERDCAGAWEKIGTTLTTTRGSHATVEGVEDDGGRVYFQIPAGRELPAGRHRVRLVVAGDLTSADAILDIVPKGSPIVVSDVDGTLTDSETAEYGALLTGAQPSMQPKADDAIKAIASKGLHVVYLTARPEWLTGRTREFLAQNSFPPGVVLTTTGITGALGPFATLFKSDALRRLQSHGHKIDWAFGNQPSDAEAYEAAKITPLDHRVFLRVTDNHGGRRIEAYSEIVPILSTAPSACK